MRVALLGRGEESITIDTTTISRDVIMEQLAPAGVTDAADCQVEVLRHERGFSLRVLISAGAAPDLDVGLVRERFRRQYHLNRLLTRPDFRELAVDHVPPRGFQRNSRGKTPFFVERHERPNQ